MITNQEGQSGASPSRTDLRRHQIDDVGKVLVSMLDEDELNLLIHVLSAPEVAVKGHLIYSAALRQGVEVRIQLLTWKNE